MEVGLFAQEVMLFVNSTSIWSVTNQLSLFPFSFIRNIIGLPCGSLSPKGMLRTYHVPFK